MRLAALALLVLAACDEGSSEVGCAFGEVHTIAEATGALFDDVELIAQGEGALLVWSERGGLYARELGARGEARGEAWRIGAPCAAGVAIAQDGERVRLACARPGDRDRGREGSVALVAIEGRAARTITTFGPVSSQSEGVSIAIDRDRALVGWRDAEGLGARAFLATVDGSTASVEQLSTARMVASAPSLLRVAGGVAVAWSESWVRPDGETEGNLLLRSQGAIRPIATLSMVDARPALGADAGGLIVAFRDQRGSAVRGFAARPPSQGTLRDRDLQSSGRADAPGSRPRVVACGGHYFQVQTRLSSREVTMVSVRRLDARLRPVEAEQQVYEYHVAFTRLGAACVGDRLVMAVGAERSETSPVPRLRTLSLACGPGVAHERTPSIEGQVLRRR